MPSGLRETTKPQFEIYYEQPWGGVASDKDPVDIAPNQVVTMQNLIIVDNVLSQFNLVADPLNFIFVGRQADSFPYIIWELNGALLACDQYGYIYVYQRAFTPVVSKWVGLNTPVIPGPSLPVVAADGPWSIGSGGNPPTAVQVINGQTYIANFSRNSIYVFDGNFAFTPASNFTGGQFFGVLDDYLLQFNTNSLTDGIQPNRVNWSGPGEFSTWDPSVDRTAGFNTLAAVEDQLTGFLSYASVGVAISQKGLIELSPTGVGIQPFSFTTLWTSVLGQGSIYPNSITQYGQRGMLTTDSGVYAVSTGAGFTDVSGTVKKALLSTLQGANSAVGTGQPPLVAASILLYFYNSPYPTPFYLMVAAPIATPGSIIVWLLDITTGVWQQSQFNVDQLVNAQNGTALAGGVVTFLQVQSIDVFPRAVLTGTASTEFTNSITIVVMRVQYPGNVFKTVIAAPYIFNRQTADSTANVAGPLFIRFRQEEIKLGRQPTIRRVLIKAYGTGTIAVSVSGVAFGNIVLDGTTVAKTYFTTGNGVTQAIYTGEDPQLLLTSANFKGTIVKVMMSGAYADGDVD